MKINLCIFVCVSAGALLGCTDADTAYLKVLQKKGQDILRKQGLTEAPVAIGSLFEKVGNGICVSQPRVLPEFLKKNAAQEFHSVLLPLYEYEKRNPASGLDSDYYRVFFVTNTEVLKAVALPTGSRFVVVEGRGEGCFHFSDKILLSAEAYKGGPIGIAFPKQDRF